MHLSGIDHTQIPMAFITKGQGQEAATIRRVEETVELIDGARLHHAVDAHTQDEKCMHPAGESIHFGVHPEVRHSGEWGSGGVGEWGSGGVGEWGSGGGGVGEWGSGGVGSGEPAPRARGATFVAVHRPVASPHAGLSRRLSRFCSSLCRAGKS